MNSVVIVGAGGVGRVVAYKCALNSDVFEQIHLISRTIEKCNQIAKEIKSKYNIDIITNNIDADDVDEVANYLVTNNITMLIHVALPYQDLHLMDACLQAGTHYLDTANYEPLDNPKFEYAWQWAYHERYKKAGLIAILGCGFDPGMTGIFTAYAAKHVFDEIHYLDIVDCNDGNHGRAFATNFNPEINIREITQKGRYYEDGKWIETNPRAIKKQITYPHIGKRDSYLIYHEELESLVKHFPTIKRARFWMTFTQEYLNHLQVIQNLGLDSIKPIEFQGNKIVPLQFLKALLPNPSSLASKYTGQTSIGCKMQGIKGNKQKTYYIYNNCHHQEAYKETNSQAVSYTTGVPAVLGAKMVLNGHWEKAGVWNIEQLNPDPFMSEIGNQGLPWYEKHNIDLAFND